jgi:formylglycine-generating enzyme required for sulfatase activity
MLKKYVLCATLSLMVFSAKVFGSGIQVLNTTVTTNTDKKSAQVKFTLTWDHSWRLADGPKNWDAAWVFIKYRTLPGDNWRHAYISTTVASHKMPGNAAFKVGSSIAVVGGTNATVGVGAFIHRKEAGNGTVSFTDIELNWNFVQNGLTGGEQVEVCVLATEMVYVPQGPFTIGDYTSAGRFRTNPSNPGTGAAPRAEGLITIGNATYNDYFSNYAKYSDNNHYSHQNPLNALAATFASVSTPAPVPDDQNPSNRNAAYRNTTNDYAFAALINTNFPRGYNEFYCMKYEITQGEYVQFLNKNLVTVKNNGTYYLTPAPTTGRFAIVKKAGTGSANVPAEFELSNASAAYLPCNYLGTKDIVAWLIWAGLRPMTELEYEKVCRGPNAVPGTASLRPQFAWGSIDIYPAAGFTNKGNANEAPSNTTGNCSVATTAGTVNTIASGTNTSIDGPLRAGGFATPISSQEKSGAGYYGAMELSGNLWERCISLGINEGRAFQGAIVNGHGNGEIGPNANPDLPIGGGWPVVTGPGLGFRGGSYLDDRARARISDRQFINLNETKRNAAFGGRGVRSDL